MKGKLPKISKKSAELVEDALSAVSNLDAVHEGYSGSEEKAERWAKESKENLIKRIIYLEQRFYTRKRPDKSKND